MKVCREVVFKEGIDSVITESPTEYPTEGVCESCGDGMGDGCGDCCYCSPWGYYTCPDGCVYCFGDELWFGYCSPNECSLTCYDEDQKKIYFRRRRETEMRNVFSSGRVADDVRLSHRILSSLVLPRV